MHLYTADMVARQPNPFKRLAIAATLGAAALGVGGCATSETTQATSSPRIESPAASPVTSQENNPNLINNDPVLTLIAIGGGVLAFYWLGLALTGIPEPKKKSSQR